MATDRYSNAFVTIDGRLLAEEASVSIQKNSGLNPVFTVAKGFAGMSQGAGTMEISIENAVPSADFEFNPDEYLKAGAVVEVGVVMANRQTVAKGFILEASYSHSVNQESKLSFKIMAGLELFE
jgi:hypothetical protein